MGETIQLLTTADVRKLLKIGNKTCLELFHREDFPCQKFGRAYKITEENLKEYCNKMQGVDYDLSKSSILCQQLYALAEDLNMRHLNLQIQDYVFFKN